MYRSTLLLHENPPYVLAPGIELPAYVPLKTDNKNKHSPLKCDACRQALTTPYYISIGIPPCSLIIDIYKCDRVSDEENIDFKRLVGKIKPTAEMYNIDNKYQWIFSEQNIKNSKTRICSDCQKEYKWRVRWGFEIQVEGVCFAIKEYQRCHTPIASAKSDYERCILSLSNRANILQQYYCDGGGLNRDVYGFVNALEGCLSMALIPDYDDSDLYFQQEFRAHFKEQFLSRNKRPLNDQELTKCIKKCINDDDHSFRIQYCKVFSNPKKHEVTIFARGGETGYTTKWTKYTVIVYYSIPKGYWEEYDI